MVSFESTDSIIIDGRGLLITTYAPYDLSSHGEFVGQTVLIDGTSYVVKGMETFMKLPPPRKGEPIGLLV